MERRTELIIFFAVLCVLVVLAYIAYTDAGGSSFLDRIGGDSKSSTLNNYVEDTRTRQTESQRDSTIKLYISLLAQGKTNTKYAPRGFSESDRAQVCAKTSEIAIGAASTEKAAQIAEFVGDFEYDWGNVVIDATGKPRQRTHKNPLQVLDAETGICGELSNTYLVMAECLDMDTYFVYGGGHAWNAIDINGAIYEVDTTQDCFDCDVSKPEHSYPLYGLCDLDHCITIGDIASLASSQRSIFDETMGK